MTSNSSKTTQEQVEQCVFCGGPATAWIVNRDFDPDDECPAACDSCCCGLNQVIDSLPIDTQAWCYIDLNRRYDLTEKELEDIGR